MSAQLPGEGDVAARHNRIMDLLFPEAADWVPLSRLPTPEIGSFGDMMGERLWAATGQSFGDGDCSTPLRLFTQAKVESLFHLADLGDGAGSALIYSAQAYCREGSLTLVWRNFDTYSRGRIEAREYRPKLLRIRQGAEPKYAGVEEGCCADPFSVYSLGSLTGRVYEQQVRVISDLVLPESATVKRGERAFKREVAFRIAPEAVDTYDEDASRYHGAATFGTIMRRYRAGVTARQVMDYRDPAGKRWGLYVIGEESDYLSIHEPIKANLGWIAE